MNISNRHYLSNVVLFTTTTIILLLTVVFFRTSTATVSLHATPCKAISLQKEWLGVNMPTTQYDPTVYSYDSMVEALVSLNISHVRVPVQWWWLEPVNGTMSQLYLDRLDSIMQKFSVAQVKTLFFFVGSPVWLTTDPLKQVDTYPPADYNLYYDRVKFLINRYESLGLDSIQIWNEVNIPGFWRPKEDPAAYSELLRGSYNMVKSINQTNVKVVMAGMAYFSEMPNYNYDWMLRVLRDNGSFSYCDAVAYHPYYFTPEGNDPNDLFSFEDKATLVNSNLNGKSVWATEWGWSTYTTNMEEQPFITELQQGDYILKRMTMLMHLCFDRVYQFTLHDLSNGVGGRDEFYGMLRATQDGSIVGKPSYFAMRNFLSFISNSSDNTILEPVDPIKPEVEPGNMHSLTVKDSSSGSIFWFYWANRELNVTIKLNTTMILGSYTDTPQIQMTFYEPLNGTSIIQVWNTTTSKREVSVEVKVWTGLRIVKISQAQQSEVSQSEVQQSEVSQAALSTTQQHFILAVLCLFIFLY